MTKSLKQKLKARNKKREKENKTIQSKYLNTGENKGK